METYLNNLYANPVPVIIVTIVVATLSGLGVASIGVLLNLAFQESFYFFFQRYPFQKPPKVWNASK